MSRPAPASTTRTGPGPWPWIVAGLLAAMIASSLAFLRVALANPDPLVVEDARAAGRGYSERLRAARRLDALGWDVQLEARMARSAASGAPSAALRVAVRDADGRPLAPDVLELVRVRPAEGGLDAPVALEPVEGAFAGRVAFPRPGRWHLRVRAQRGEEAVERTFAVRVP